MVVGRTAVVFVVVVELGFFHPGRGRGGLVVGWSPSQVQPGGGVQSGWWWQGRWHDDPSLLVPCC